MRQDIVFLAESLWVGFFQIRSHRFHVVDSLGRRHSGLEMSECLKDRAVVTACVENVFPIHLVLIHDGHEEIGSDKQQRPVELGGATPMTVKGCLFSCTVRPSTPRSSAKRLCQYA